MHSPRELSTTFHKYPTLPGDYGKRRNAAPVPGSLRQCIVSNYLSRQNIYWRCQRGLLIPISAFVDVIKWPGSYFLYEWLLN